MTISFYDTIYNTDNNDMPLTVEKRLDITANFRIILRPGRRNNCVMSLVSPQIATYRMLRIQKGSSNIIV